jgi:hypothetical protein
MPLEIRVAIDDARFDKERLRPSEPFHAESDLSIAVASIITASIPLEDLRPVFTAAQKKLGLGRSPAEPREAAKPSVYATDPPTQPQPERTKAALVKASTPPPAPAPITSSPSVVPPTVRASTPPPAHSRPPPAVPGYAPPPSIGTPKKQESASPSPKAAPKASAAALPTSMTIPEALHHISGEEERTNPWDIPTEETHPRGEKG